MGIQNKLIQILIGIVGLLIALWLITSSVALPEYYQIAVIAVIVVTSLLTFTWRKLAFDFKFLALVLLGYAVAGKGFAYLSPVEPLYVGELAMCICALGLIMRYFKGSPLMPTNLHWFLLLWMVTVGIYLGVTVRERGVMAVRDSAIAYYAFFFFATFAMFNSDYTIRTFAKVTKYCALLGYSGCFLYSSGLFDLFIAPYPLVRYYFTPHPDIFIPLTVGGAVYGLLMGMSKRSIMLLVFGGVGFLLLVFTKTAGIFCLIIVIGMLVVFGRRMDILFTSLSALLVAGVTVGILIASGSSFVEEKLLKSDQIQTISDVGEASGTKNSSTSDWRISWWTIVVQDTLEEDPMFGVGMGGDLSSHFVSAVLKIDPQSEEGANFARYPHNIVFTVFGRMGTVGLLIFIFPFTAMWLFAVRFVRRHLNTPEENEIYLIPYAVFVAGLANSLVQSTYEVPFGAIPHWSFLGFLAAYAYQWSRKTPSSAPLPKLRGAATSGVIS